MYQTSEVYLNQPLLFAAYIDLSGNGLSCILSFSKLVSPFSMGRVDMWILQQLGLLVFRDLQQSLAVSEINLSLKWGHSICNFFLLQSFRLMNLHERNRNRSIFCEQTIKRAFQEDWCFCQYNLGLFHFVPQSCTFLLRLNVRTGNYTSHSCVVRPMTIYIKGPNSSCLRFHFLWTGRMLANSTLCLSLASVPLPYQPACLPLFSPCLNLYFMAPSCATISLKPFLSTSSQTKHPVLEIQMVLSSQYRNVLHLVII